MSLKTTVPNRLSGRIGGRVDGKDVRLSTAAPLEVAALAAVIAFEALEQDHQSSAAASS
ncbi:hypothetical protein [Calidithermus terrae]|uniref:hypothetical protein n=1 Tax=Calidithermus terrae TaxID=1408545 RepID=UPI00159C8270|nr:hypothetical protein [Calidithermus terrae]